MLALAVYSQRAIITGPESGIRKRVARKADGKLTLLVNLGVSWHEKLAFLVMNEFDVCSTLHAVFCGETLNIWKRLPILGYILGPVTLLRAIQSRVGLFEFRYHGSPSEGSGKGDPEKTKSDLKAKFRL